MTWVRLDDSFHNSRKVLALMARGTLGFAALGLWSVTRTWTAQQRSGGVVPAAVVYQMAGSPARGEAWAARLVEVGLWTPLEGGWQIHDADKYTSKLSETRAVAGRKGAERRWQTDGKPDGKPMANAKVANGKPMANDSSRTDARVDPGPEVQVLDLRTTEVLDHVTERNAREDEPSPTTEIELRNDTPLPASALAAVARIDERLVRARKGGVNAWSLPDLVASEWDVLHDADDGAGCVGLVAWYAAHAENRAPSTTDVIGAHSLTQNFGRIGLEAITAALNGEVHERIWPYATKVARRMHAERRAS